ncbi:hypothetical protein FO519_007923 [Halicephalobus sp. NKZ332]|nr:hypothetical protein FO519_007923 [Halicephalobus sp. NKZ332]
MEFGDRRRALTELVSTKTVVGYDELMTHLKFQDEQAFETFIINSIYDGVIDGQLDPLKRQFDVTDFSDCSVPVSELPGMLTTLENWSAYTEDFLKQLEEQVKKSDAGLHSRIEAEKELTTKIAQKKEEARERENAATTTTPHFDPGRSESFSKDLKRARNARIRR